MLASSLGEGTTTLYTDEWSGYWSVEAKLKLTHGSVKHGEKEWARDDSSRARWIKALAEHPKLIQRPIITADDGTATVARTPEAVRAALDKRPDAG